jgi:hypothetical protein
MAVRVRRVLDVTVRDFVSATTVIGLVLLLACGHSPYRLEFGDLRTADQVEVISDTLTIMTSREQIAAAAAFFNEHRDGWTSVMDGGGAPLYVGFKKNGVDLGTFGVGPGYLSMGSARLHPPEADIAAFVRSLGRPWPPYQATGRPH